ncbi:MULTISPECIES: hypothetical protein [Streptomyces]|uniref:Uncharacterized protein n=1 Tax=Streptomyces glycanivorans TaxID=3033808 RepID=A0ABY9J4H8_9ACTN|nr:MULTISPECIES: hypothetical protein [unclassified Streptomyces]WLQ62095.1 hypothetical protein P8A20_00145 [Streptomyces sp. Alt3]WSQ75604.1 hypothetical protein OG725_00255 [Streptomyces sp. NBC_01213]WSR04529.1 hypothetical protein OG265_00175 [Streptomyces sp. NBC_01208]WSR52821.1 hypothetical protein OG279_36685 [Streptomyces sp. NBC_01201]
MRDGAVQVKSDFDGRLKWRSRYLVHRARRRGQTGLLLQVDLRDPPRSMSLKWCLVSVTESGRQLCSVDRTSIRKVRFITLPPGPHPLHFEVTRHRKRRSTQVQQNVVLGKGDVLLVTCDPVQPNVFYRRSPAVDSWSAQILHADPNA